MTHLWHHMVQNHLNPNYCVFLEIFVSPVQILWRCCLIPKRQVTCDGGVCSFSFSFFFKVVSATKSSPVDRTHPPPIISMLHALKETRTYICPRASLLPRPGTRPRCYQFSHWILISGPSPWNQILGPLSVYPCVFLSRRKKKPQQQTYLGAKWRVSGWMRRIVVVIMQIKKSLYEERPSAATYQKWIDQFKWWKKKRNCSPAIMKTEEEQVNQKQQALGLNTLW